MSIFDARPGHVSNGGYAPMMSRKDFLEKSLAAIKKRRGLIHGAMQKDGRVCALGAFASKNDNCCVDIRLAEEMQELNDSMPKASPATRRKKVMKWIEEKLAALT